MTDTDKSGTERSYKLNCVSCNHIWTETVKGKYRIGLPEKWGFKVNRGKVCRNKKGYGTCAPIECPFCYTEGRHQYCSTDTDTEQ